MPTANDGSKIKRIAAKQMIQNYQETPYFKGSGIKGGFIGRNHFYSILNQPNCVGVRYYHALNADGNHTIILVGEDAAGTTLSDGVLIDEGPLCPPWCGVGNLLDA